MEMEELQPSKRSQINNGWNSGGYEGALVKIDNNKDGSGGEGINTSMVGDGGGGGARLRAWHQHSSRICRVRASGGKDRHSKVLTAKGLRDRRVRLSVSTAIQFYDLQDRLGVDQPSKAVEWLIKAASAAISELPALDGPFADGPLDQMIVEKLGEEPRRGVDADGANRNDDDDDSAAAEHDFTEHQQQQQHLSLTKSGCSSTSETSKGSVLSLSRSEIRVKARERAKERAAKEKEKKERDDDVHPAVASSHQLTINHNPSNSQSSFTELLTGGVGSHAHGSVTLAHANPSSGCGGASFVHKQHIHHLPSVATADYFGQAGLFGQGQKPHPPLGYPAQTHFGNSSHIGMVPFSAVAAAAAGCHPEMQQQQYSFLQDHLIPVAAVAAATGGDYSINFSISSSGLAGFNRGTLQSNSPSPMPHHQHQHQHHHLQRLSSQVDGSNLPFFLSASAAATPPSSASGENSFPAGYDGRLQLCYGDGYRHADIKGKGKG